MSVTSYLLIFSLITSGLIIFYMSFKTKKPIRCLFLTASSGIGSLLGLNLLSYITGVSLAVNAFTLLISGIGGIAGVVGLLICNVLL